MTTRITTLIRKLTWNIPRLALLGSLVAAASLFAGDSPHEHSSPANLVQIVRDATRQFIDVNAATDAGYGNSSAVSAVRTTARWACTTSTAPRLPMARSTPRSPKRSYEFSHGRARQSFQLVGSPNRYGIPAPFFELHVGPSGTTPTAPSWTGTTG
jgi:hypothetical protein